MKTKKQLLMVGSLVTIIVPVVSIVACNQDKKEDKDKIDVDISNLVKTNFKLTGINGAGTLAWKDETQLPSEVEVKFAKEASNLSEDEVYSTSFPTQLSNGDKIYIMFSIKSDSVETHKFPTDFTNPIIFLVADLMAAPKIDIDTSKLIKSSFQLIGSADKATFVLKDGIALPSEVEARYAIKYSIPDENDGYSTSPLTGLDNSDKVHIKFFIKSDKTKSHKFPEDFNNYITFTVDNLKYDLTAEKDKFINFISGDLATKKDNDFTVLGAGITDVKTKFIAINGYKSPSLLYGVSISKVTIKKAYNSSTRQVVFTVYLKKARTRFANNSKDIIVSFAKTNVDTSILVVSNFKATGENGSGIFAIKDGIIFPPEVEARFAEGLTAPAGDKGYSTTIPTELANGNKVFIKFFIKQAFVNTHKLPTTFTNPIVFTVDALLFLLIEDKNKFTAFTSTDGGVNEFRNLEVAGPADVKDKFIAITGYSSPSLTAGVSISKVTIKTGYNKTTKQVVFAVYLQKVKAGRTIEEATDVTVTFT